MDKVLKTVTNTVPEENCTGCSACANICPQKALKMSENCLGHEFPMLLSDRCIDCGLCLRTCPSLNPQKGNKPKQVYAAWSKDIDEHLSSTSGGVASVISRTVIRNGGIVFGCAFVKGKGIVHIAIDDEKQIAYLKGSKYAQSIVGNSYNEVKKCLVRGRKVLFIGTPCQVAGLKNYLKVSHENLITIGLVCHGVPPQKLLFEHLASKGVPFDSIFNISFRSQTPPQYKLTIYGIDGPIYSKTILEDLYYSAFNDCLTFRESCVKCNYSNMNRVEDITLGDFHGLGSDIPFPYKSHGNISVVLVNTVIGDSVLNSCVNNLEIVKRSLSEAQKQNPQLREPAIRRANYKKFIKLYEHYGFERAASIVLWKRKFKNLIIRFRNAIS